VAHGVFLLLGKQGKVMKEQVYWIDQNGIQQSQWVTRDHHNVKRWIARDGSGQGFVSYSLVLGMVSTVAAVLYGLSVGAFNHLLLTIVTSMQ
jgi:hypothetical protein